MLLVHNEPLIAFVWQPENIASALVQMVGRTSIAAIFDLSQMDLETAGKRLIRAAAGVEGVHVLISQSAFMDASLEKFLNSTGISSVWVEFHPVLFEVDSALMLTRLKQLSSTYQLYPVIADVNFLFKILAEYPQISNIALKGCEAAGFVSAETTLTLFASAREALCERPYRPNLIIWGGIGTPEAAAAFLATGANGVVFESLHWLTDMVCADDLLKASLAKLRPEATELIGTDLDVPCRVFNKGNSLAVKKIKVYAASLESSGITQEKRRVFARRIQTQMAPPLNCRFDRHELIPLGLEACFAQGFIERYGHHTPAALENFRRDIEELCADAGERKKSFLQGERLRELGIRYPFIQGAMTWITDSVEFAQTIADAGGLPTLALGVMDKDTLAPKLGNPSSVMTERPYAVNLLALAENPFLNDQLEWIKDNCPPFVVVAAGSPSIAAKLNNYGCQVIYIAPNGDMLKLALQAGIRYVICEGNEAGGHVGRHTTLTFAQTVIEMKRREPSLFKNFRFILAGGIFNGDTVSIAALLGADAVQMGTVYLGTEEIVQTGALAKLYQQMILSASIGGTVLTGESVGLPVRSLRSAKIKSVHALERSFLAGNEGEAAFRRRMEELTAGSLLIAARGLDKPGGAPVSKEFCLEQGQFMSGACAGAIDRIRSVKQLHRELADKLMEQRPSPFVAISQRTAAEVKADQFLTTEPCHRRPCASRAIHRSNGRERIAVTGMSIVNSLGNDPEQVWTASVNMKSGVTRVPASKWYHELFYDPEPYQPEKTYCRVGAFKNIAISRKEIGISPHDFKMMSGSTRLTMYLAKKAIEQSGIADSGIPRERIGVVIAQNSGERAGTVEDIVIRASTTQILESIKRVMNLTPDLEHAIVQEIKAGRMAIDDTTLVGRLNSTAAGFISNKYGFMGPSYSVSAACSTSLVALYCAVQMIRNGIIDAAVVGGGEEDLTPADFLEFSALGVLSGISGIDRPPEETCRPFDMGRDGMVLGEGGGMVVVERESMAQKRGIPVQAYITGMGASNNPDGLVEPSASTQKMAILSSFRDADRYGPRQVDLVECHATATVQGDLEEVKALANVYRSEGKTVITSLKSQTGHTLGAAGLNNLIRGIMAMKNAVLPPTINCQTPDPRFDIKGSGLMVCTDPLDWKDPNGLPRRLQINAFGFGGSNYVAQLEECREGSDNAVFLPSKPARVLQVDHHDDSFIKKLFFSKTKIDNRPYRLAIISDTREKARHQLRELKRFPEKTPLGEKHLRSFSRKGIYLAPEKASSLSLAFVFPGQGSQYPGMGKEFYETCRVIRQSLEHISNLADFDILDFLFQADEENLRNTLRLQPALFGLECALGSFLMSLGVRPDAVAGHSLGEYAALCTAQVFSLEDGFLLVKKRAQCMDKAAAIHGDPGVMLAVNSRLEDIQSLIRGRKDIFVTNINSPSQVVLGGSPEAMSTLRDELNQMKIRNIQLKVGMAFHSPHMRVIRDEFASFIDSVPFYPPQIPIISNTTGKVFPADPPKIKKVLINHLESPVLWTQCVQTLWDDYGIRIFAEIGPGDVLSNLISGTLTKPECMPTCLSFKEGETLKAALAELYVRGRLPAQPVSIEESLFASADASANSPEKLQSCAAHKTSGLSDSKAIEKIIQHEFQSLMAQPLGSFLKTSLLNAIRRDYNPSFTESDLQNILKSSLLDMESGLLTRGTSSQDMQSSTFCLDSDFSNMKKSPGPGEPMSTEPANILEALIGIIMDTTGYERDEIEPDMDLKEDLSIRSTRIPVIMDAAERIFGIKIDLEEFIGVRTIRDMATRTGEIIARGSDGSCEWMSQSRGGFTKSKSKLKAPETFQAIKRVVFSEQPLEISQFSPVELRDGDGVAVFAAERQCGLARNLKDIFQREYGVSVTLSGFLKRASRAETAGFDLRVEKDALGAAARLSETPSLAGLVFILDGEAGRNMVKMEEISSILRGFFMLLKTFVQSSNKKFVFLIHRTKDTTEPVRLLTEGILGMFLSVAQEFKSVQFRALCLDSKTELGDGIRNALNTASPVIENIYRDAEIFTSAGQVGPSFYHADPNLELSSDSVVILSGGGRGITAHLARAFIPVGTRLVLLGKTRFDPDLDYNRFLNDGDPDEDSICQMVRLKNAKLSQKEIQGETKKILKGLEINRTLLALRASGVEVSYYACDVTDKGRVEAVLGDIFKHYGRIDGIIHGAGTLKDSLIINMSPGDFCEPVNVKLYGAWNLFQAAERFGLKFFVTLSSVVSVHGNMGQANYACANRALSALVKTLARKHSHIRFMSLILPPIEGSGMAQDPQTRKLMEIKGWGEQTYIHVNELRELFSRELFATSNGEPIAMFVRSLPRRTTSHLDITKACQSPGKLGAGTTVFHSRDFPLIDSVEHLDLRNEKLVAQRIFSREKDLWIEDHKPFKFVKHPLISAIMALEAFMEASRLLYPYLFVRGVRKAKFLEMIECPSGVDRTSQIICQRIDSERNEIVCDASLSTQDISPTGRKLNRMSLNFNAQVILSRGKKPSWNKLPGFPVRPDELEVFPMDHNDLLKMYHKTTDFKGRYLLLNHLDGIGPGAIRGKTIYSEGQDFSDHLVSHYQYSPYLLEAVLHLVATYTSEMDAREEGLLIPLEIGQLVFWNKAKSGDEVTLEARQTEKGSGEVCWNARCLDKDGHIMMQVRDIRMDWLCG